MYKKMRIVWGRERKFLCSVTGYSAQKDYHKDNQNRANAELCEKENKKYSKFVVNSV